MDDTEITGLKQARSSEVVRYTPGTNNDPVSTALTSDILEGFNVVQAKHESFAQTKHILQYVPINGS